MEELQEADVVWPVPDPNHVDGVDCYHRSHHAKQPHSSAARPAHLSAPVRIPVSTDVRPKSRRTSCSWARSCCDGVDGHDGMRTDSAAGAAPAAIVPPHVIAARRCSEERVAASSVCVGNGRTLKGRDLRTVRNAVLHMTGFLGSSDKY